MSNPIMTVEEFKALNKLGKFTVAEGAEALGWTWLRVYRLLRRAERARIAKWHPPQKTGGAHRPAGRWEVK